MSGGTVSAKNGPAGNQKASPKPGTRRDEHALRAAFAVSSTGDWIFRFALPLIVLQESGSALLAAVTYALEYVPYLIVGLVSGIVADRCDRRRLIVACDALSAVITGVVAVLCLSDSVPLATVMTLAFLVSAVRPFHFPAFQGMLSERVPAARRPGMNAWLQGTDSLLMLLGPVAGAAIVAFVGPAAACALNAVSFTVSSFLIWIVRSRTVIPHPAQRGGVRTALGSIRPDFVAGLRALAADSAVLWGTVLLTVTNFAMLAVQSNLPFLTAGPSGSDTSALATVLVAQGAGALIGSFVAPTLMRQLPAGRVIVVGMGLLVIALTGPALSHTVVPLSAALFLSGLAISAIVVPWRTYRQEVVPEAYMGRVVAVQRTVGFALNLLGAVLGGLLLTTLGPAALFLCAGAIQMAVWVSAWRGPVGKAGAPSARSLISRPATVTPAPRP